MYINISNATLFNGNAAAGVGAAFSPVIVGAKDPNFSLQLNTPAAAGSVTVTVYKGPTPQGPWTTVGTLSASTSGIGSASDSFSAANCKGTHWFALPTAVSGDVTATAAVWMEA